MRPLQYIVLLYFFIPSLYCSTFNRSLFFRTASFWDEPRFEKNCLTSFDISFLGGATHHSRNCCSKRVDLLDLYNNRELLCSTFDKETVKLTGKFSLFEADINFYQNFTRGFFLHFHMPIIATQLKLVKNKSVLKERKNFPDGSIFPRCNLFRGFKASGLSDSSLLLGWAYTYSNTCLLDYVDISFQAGALLPTGKKRNVGNLLSIPLGYNGHSGFSFLFDIAIGAFDWFTIGAHADVIAFVNKYECFLLENKDIINSNINSGPVWRVGGYTKADHFCGPLSFLLALDYEQKNRSVVCNETNFQSPINLELESLKKWARLTLHIMLEYEFTTEESLIGKRIALFYNQELIGKRVFALSTPGGVIGLDLIWQF